MSAEFNWAKNYAVESLARLKAIHYTDQLD